MYHIDWMQKKRVIHLTLSGNVSPIEVRTAYDALVVYYDEGDAPLYLLVDHTGIQRYPVGLNTYDFLIDGAPASKFNRVLVVGPNRQVRFLVRLFARVRQVPALAFETEQEALAFLQQHNAPLPDANVN